MPSDHTIDLPAGTDWSHLKEKRIEMDSMLSGDDNPVEPWSQYVKEMMAEESNRRTAHKQAGNRLLSSLIKSKLGADVTPIDVRTKFGKFTLVVCDRDGVWEPRLRAVVRCRRCGNDVYSTPIDSPLDIGRLESENFVGHPAHDCHKEIPCLG